MGGICDRPSPGHLHLARDGVRCIHTGPNIAEGMRKTLSINGIRGFLRNRSYGGRHSGNTHCRHVDGPLPSEVRLRPRVRMLIRIRQNLLEGEPYGKGRVVVVRPRNYLCTGGDSVPSETGGDCQHRASCSGC